MSEYISRESVKDVVRSGISTDTEADKEYVYGLIDSIPSADVRENIHGHWERDTEIDGYRCSNCGSTGMDYWNGCPYCLADMREPKGEKGTE